MTPGTSQNKGRWSGLFIRWIKFNAVGAIGVGVQLLMLTLLAKAGVYYLISTGLAVEAAVLHNFLWHEHYTWRDRTHAELPIRPSPWGIDQCKGVRMRDDAVLEARPDIAIRI